MTGRVFSGVALATMLQVMPLVTVAQGGSSLITGTREVVIRSAGEWQALWKEHNPQPPPVIDFSSSMVVGIFLGTRPTAGYRVDVVATKIEGDSLVVEYSERGPRPGAVAAQVLTSPFHIVKLPARPGTVLFRKVDPPA